MKKAILLGIVCAFVSTLAFAQAPAANMAIKGTIIDNQCASAQKPEALAEFVKTHTKECAIKPACEASGYSIFENGKLMKFDKESNLKIAAFLKKSESTLNVMVVAKKNGDMLSLVSIENQK